MIPQADHDPLLRLVQCCNTRRFHHDIMLLRRPCCHLLVDTPTSDTTLPLYYSMKCFLYALTPMSVPTCSDESHDEVESTHPNLKRNTALRAHHIASRIMRRHRLPITSYSCGSCSHASCSNLLSHVVPRIAVATHTTGLLHVTIYC